jgi:hypothetical protein
MFDGNVFRMAAPMITGYGGGSWGFHDVDNGAAFMAINDDKTPMTLTNLISGESIANVDVITAGMIVTSFALVLKIENTRNEVEYDFLVRKYDLLNDAIVSRCTELNRMDIWMTLMD